MGPNVDISGEPISKNGSCPTIKEPIRSPQKVRAESSAFSFRLAGSGLKCWYPKEYRITARRRAEIEMGKGRGMSGIRKITGAGFRGSKLRAFMAGRLNIT